MEEASDLFAAKGFTGCTLREICDRLGISSPALLHHFGTKKRLYSEVLARIAASISPYLPAADAVPDRDGVLKMVDAYLDWAVAYPQYSQLIMRELVENRERVDKAKNLTMRATMKAFSDFIRKGQQMGSLPQFDADVFPFLFTGAIGFCEAATPTARRILDVPSDKAMVDLIRACL